MNNKIDSHHLYHAIMTGAEKIVDHCDLLNQMNGFPVPDRDTGNNLSYLMEYIARNVKPVNNIKALMEEVSNAAIIGARGNSGAIFSQFFTGFEQKCPQDNHMDLQTLGLCFETGYAFAYRAIKDPVEGTILTVMKSFVQALNRLVKAGPGEDGLKLTLDGAFEALSQSLDQTKHMVKQQAKLKAEDAGAKAFFYFISGFREVILSGPGRMSKTYRLEREGLAHPLDFDHAFTDDLSFRYCTEILIRKNENPMPAQVEKDLEKMGKSLVISRNKTLARIHIHSNQPGQVARLMSTYGQILETKADDMLAQKTLTYNHEGEIALVIDTVADIPAQLMPDFVYQLPLTLMVDKVSYQDKRTVFPELLKAKKISSSQSNRNQVKSFLSPIVDRYQHTIIITPSAKMSGLYQRYQEFCEQMPDKISLIDSKLNSVAQGLVVYRAIELIKQAKDLEFIKQDLAATIKRTKIYVSLLHLDAMIRSGRLNHRVGWFLKKIGFLPLITINSQGEGKVEGLAFSQKQNEKIFFAKAMKDKDRIETYAIVHAHARDRAEKAGERLTAILGKPPLFIEQISYIVTNFSGQGSIAIGYTLKA